MGAAHDLAIELRDVAKKEARLARIQELEDGIYDHAAAVVDAQLSFHEVEPGQKDPPPEWIERYGADGARQRLNVAKSGWLPPSLTPSGVKLAAQVMAGISRGRVHKRLKVHTRELNVRIALPAPTTAEHPGPVVYPTKEIDV